jgi:hypothetical protein
VAAWGTRRPRHRPRRDRGRIDRVVSARCHREGTVAQEAPASGAAVRNLDEAVRSQLRHQVPHLSTSAPPLRVVGRKWYNFCTLISRIDNQYQRQIDKSALALNERNVILPPPPPNTTLVPRTAQVPGRRSGGSQSMLPVADDTQCPVSSSEKG